MVSATENASAFDWSSDRSAAQVEVAPPELTGNLRSKNCDLQSNMNLEGG